MVKVNQTPQRVLHVVIGAAGTADRRVDAGFAQAVRIPNRQVLRAPIGMMNQPVGFGRPAVIHGLLQRIQNELTAAMFDRILLNYGWVSSSQR